MKEFSEEEVAELRALMKMRAEVHKRLRELTLQQVTEEAVREARRVIEAAEALRQKERRERFRRHAGWGVDYRVERVGWSSVWTTAKVGRQ